MFNPAQLTLGEIAQVFRDLTIVAVVVKVAWSSRGFYDQVKTFFQRLVQHMEFMEKGMTTLLENHLKHIGSDLRELAKNKAVPGQE